MGRRSRGRSDRPTVGTAAMTPGLRARRDRRRRPGTSERRLQCCGYLVACGHPDTQMRHQPHLMLHRTRGHPSTAATFSETRWITAPTGPSPGIGTPPCRPSCRFVHRNMTRKNPLIMPRFSRRQPSSSAFARTWAQPQPRHNRSTAISLRRAQNLPSVYVFRDARRGWMICGV